MELAGRIFSDHLSYLLASPQVKGALDPATMVMYLPSRWREEPLGLLVRAHELIHLRLTYSTGLGILLDMIGGLSSVKMFNLLKNTVKGEVLFPLSRNLQDRANINKQVRGSVAFCIICDIGLDAGIDVWRYLQEGVATYLMLELAPEKIAEEAHFSKSEVSNARAEIHSRLYGIYHKGYLECLRASNVLGRDQVYPVAMLASDVPLYAIRLFTGDDETPLEITGLTFHKEIKRFCQYISSKSMTPTERFRTLVQAVHNKGVDISNKRNLEVFRPFLVPDLFPDADWQNRVDKWVSTLTSAFGTGSDLKNRALNLYQNVVERGWSPILLYPEEDETRVGFLNGFEETAILRYVLNSLKMACARTESTTVHLPSNWNELSIRNWIQDFLEIIERHELPVYLEELNSI